MIRTSARVYKFVFYPTYNFRTAILTVCGIWHTLAIAATRQLWPYSHAFHKRVCITYMQSRIPCNSRL